MLLAPNRFVFMFFFFCQSCAPLSLSFRGLGVRYIRRKSNERQTSLREMCACVCSNVNMTPGPSCKCPPSAPCPAAGPGTPRRSAGDRGGGRRSRSASYRSGLPLSKQSRLHKNAVCEHLTLVCVFCRRSTGVTRRGWRQSGIKLNKKQVGRSTGSQNRPKGQPALRLSPNHI